MSQPVTIALDAMGGERAPDMVTTGVRNDFIEGVGKVDERLIILIVVDKLFTAEERDELMELTTSAPAEAA